MPMLKTKIENLKVFPSPEKILSQLEEQTVLNVVITVAKYTSNGTHKISSENYSNLSFPPNGWLDYKITFLVPDKRVVSRNVSCRIFQHYIEAIFFAEVGFLNNKYPYYYTQAAIFALEKVTSGTRNDFYSETYGKLKWAEWCELNGGPVPPLWKRILAKILGWFLLLLWTIFILGLWTVFILVIAFIFRTFLQ